MKKLKGITLVLVTMLAISGIAVGAEYTVGQKNKKFSVDKLRINIGDTVYFTNQDPFSHNVYSLSDIKSFDLGSFPRGESKAVVFDKVGKIPVECAIHPYMYLEITVEE